jgi:hypothetical protein
MWLWLCLKFGLHKHYVMKRLLFLFFVLASSVYAQTPVKNPKFQELLNQAPVAGSRLIFSEGDPSSATGSNSFNMTLGQAQTWLGAVLGRSTYNLDEISSVFDIDNPPATLLTPPGGPISGDTATERYANANLYWTYDGAVWNLDFARGGGVIHASEFGVSPGNTAAANLIALNNAYAAAVTASKSVLKLPAGNIPLDPGFVISDSIVVEGAGRGFTVLDASTMPDANDTLIGFGALGITATIRDMTIIGPAAPLTNNVWGIGTKVAVDDVNQFNNVIIERVRIIGFRDQIENGTTDHGLNLTVNDCVLESSARYCLNFWQNAAATHRKRLILSNSSVGGNSNSHLLYLHPHTDTFISGNLFFGSTIFAIQYETGLAEPAGSQIIANNTFRGNSRGIVTPQGDNKSKLIIANNRFENGSGDISVRGSVNFYGNVINYNGGSNFMSVAAGADGPYQVNISNNIYRVTAMGVADYLGVFNESDLYINITNNNCYFNGNAAGQNRGFAVGADTPASPIHRGTISGNTFIASAGTTTNLYLDVGDGAFNVSNNLFRGASFSSRGLIRYAPAIGDASSQCSLNDNVIDISQDVGGSNSIWIGTDAADATGDGLFARSNEFVGSGVFHNGGASNWSIATGFGTNPISQARATDIRLNPTYAAHEITGAGGGGVDNIFIGGAGSVNDGSIMSGRVTLMASATLNLNNSGNIATTGSAGANKAITLVFRKSDSQWVVDQP